MGLPLRSERDDYRRGKWYIYTDEGDSGNRRSPSLEALGVSGLRMDGCLSDRYMYCGLFAGRAVVTRPTS